MSQNKQQTQTLRNRTHRRSKEFSERSLPRRGSGITLGLKTDQHSLLSFCPARDCVCSIPQRSPNNLQLKSEKFSFFGDDRDKYYTVSRCGSQVSIQNATSQSVLQYCIPVRHQIHTSARLTKLQF